MLVGDLDSIVMKALAKDVDRRYGGVAQLADDIRRHLRHEPVSSRPRTRRYLLAKFVRRHRPGVTFAATLAVLVLASLATIWALTLQSLQRLEHGNLFGLAMYVHDLRERDAMPPAARPENLAALQQWLHEFELVLAQSDRLRAFVDAPEVGTGEATDPAGWASGSYAQRVLRDRLRNALEVLGAMTRPGAEIDKMRLRIDWAQRVTTLTVDTHREAWARVRREVLADWGFDVPPQPGLVPLGRDEATKLQEFALPLPGADMPQRRGGRWVVGDRTCPVFVLLPGGDTLVGAQQDDRQAPHFDEHREPFEERVQQVRLAPFFAAKYEFTNGQWQLVDPGDHGEVPQDALFEPTHPLVDANLEWLQHVAQAWGMRLPTAHEWEYLARAGTDTPRWCGATAASLEGHENVFDQSLGDEGEAEGPAVPWTDEFRTSAPVGSYPPNPFLLHDVLGNAAEVAVRAQAEDGWDFELRGGSWHQGAQAARATHRTTWEGGPRPSIGFRPVISVQP
jgi:formylglycine-generating enzyme required for sulfatase activity